jgi:hypothetical protein
MCMAAHIADVDQPARDFDGGSERSIRRQIVLWASTGEDRGVQSIHRSTQLSRGRTFVHGRLTWIVSTGMQLLKLDN